MRQRDHKKIAHPLTGVCRSNEIAELAKDGLNRQQISERLAIPYATVCGLIRANGIECKHYRPARGINRTAVELRKGAADGLTQGDMAAKLGVSHQFVSLICKRFGIKMADGRVIHNKKRKRLSESITEDMLLALIKAEFTKSNAARKFGISLVTLNRVIAELGVIWPTHAVRTRKSAEKVAKLKKMAAEGMNKNEAAKALGCFAPGLHAFIGRNMPEVKWQDGRIKRANK